MAIRCWSAKIAVLTCAALCCCPFAGLGQQSREQTKKEQPKTGKKTPDNKQASLSGCVDEQDGHYVLIHDQTRALIAQLEADGFETEGFAKHLGHKVTVRGTGNSSGTERPIFKVRSIESLGDGCGPQAL